MKILKSLFKDREVRSVAGSEESILVQALLQNIVGREEKVSRKFLEELQELEPDLASQLKRDTSLSQQNLAHLFKQVLTSLTDQQGLLSCLQDLRKISLNYTPREEYYSAVGASLLSAVESVYGSGWNEEIQNALIRLYTRIAIMVKVNVSKAA